MQFGKNVEVLDFAKAVPAAMARPWYKTYFPAMSFPFWGLHILALVGAIITGLSWTAVITTAAIYTAAMWFVTAGYHRYFSHRTFKTGRVFQFILALGAQLTFQKGALWWAAHHRHHHKESDNETDLHSAKQGGFFWSHMGWILTSEFDVTNLNRVKDLAKYPELVWLNRYWMVPGLTWAVLSFVIGGLWGLTWAFAVPVVFNWHGTFTINSLSHVFGKKVYETGDESRNNWLLAIITHGEGWHNNHHHYQAATRQGFRWYQYDFTFYVLWVMSKIRLVRDLHSVPDYVIAGTTKKVHELAAMAKAAMPEVPTSEMIVDAAGEAMDKIRHSIEDIADDIAAAGSPQKAER